MSTRHDTTSALNPNDIMVVWTDCGQPVGEPMTLAEWLEDNDIPELADDPGIAEARALLPGGYVNFDEDSGLLALDPPEAA